MRTRHFLLTLAVVILFAGCVSKKTDRAADPDGGVDGKLVAYLKVLSERHGIVGYVNVFEETDEAIPDAKLTIYEVLDLDFRSRGILYPNGRGVRYVYLPPEMIRAKGVTREEIPLVAQPLELNLAICLGVEGPVKTAPATVADLQRP